jgi:hypothetical protein
MSREWIVFGFLEDKIGLAQDLRSVDLFSPIGDVNVLYTDRDEFFIIVQRGRYGLRKCVGQQLFSCADFPASILRMTCGIVSPLTFNAISPVDGKSMSNRGTLTFVNTRAAPSGAGSATTWTWARRGGFGATTSGTTIASASRGGLCQTSKLRTRTRRKSRRAALVR